MSVSTTGRRQGAALKTVQRAAAFAAFYYPFTASGTLLFAVGLMGFVTGIRDRNPYAILLGFIALVFLTVSAVLARLQAARLSDRNVEWELTGPVYAERDGMIQRFSFDRLTVFPFFRLNVIVSGPLVAGRKVRLHYRREISITGGDSAELPFYYPLSGVFHARSVTRIRDIFGLSVARFGTVTQRQIIVQPGLSPDFTVYRVEAAGGHEEKSRKKSAEEEKYYMREYIPGDRFRDINWKSSSRLSQLITRISPQAQEKTKIVQVLLRNYAQGERDSLVSAAHLHFAKTKLMSFLRRVKKDQPEYRFHVMTADAALRVLETEQDIETFGLEVGSMFFQNDAFPKFELSFGECYVFTTPYDTKLAAFTAAHENVKFHVYRTAFPPQDGERIPGGTGGSDGKASQTGPESDSVKNGHARIRTVRLLPLSGLMPLPDFTTLTARMKRPGAVPGAAPGAVMEDEPIDIRLA
jgi:hypothetical protein